jgi:hypothetical protein
MEEDLVIIIITTTTGRGDIPGEEGVTFTASITTRRRRAREDGNASPFRRLLFNLEDAGDARSLPPPPHKSSSSSVIALRCLSRERETVLLCGDVFVGKRCNKLYMCASARTDKGTLSLFYKNRNTK